MGKRDRFVHVFRYLQDPHLVARFQQICGVRGASSGAVGVGSPSGDSSASEERLQRHNNGACLRHLPGRREGEGAADVVPGEGDRATAAGVRMRITNSDLTTSSSPLKSRDEGDCLPQNGAVFSGALSGRDSEDQTLLQSSTVKPLRKNSLTGDAGQEFLIENRLLYYLFTFGTELGNELFYITFFPFLIWNIDAFVGRRLIMVWVWVMYLGQCTKDVIGWSRPASPPVVKVEMFYNSEYSMPSTHAMSGTAIPFSLFIMTCGRWEYPFSLGFSLALCWCLLVCLSRIYMGMHSVLDVMAGVLYSVLILTFFLPALDLIDGFNLTFSYAPLIIISIHLGLGLFSFTLDTWSTSRGDTAQILGVGAGLALASHVNHHLGLLPDPPLDQLPFSMPRLSVGLAAMAILRTFLGVLILVATRALMKAITIPLVCWVVGVPSGDVRKARQHMEVELPYRYITYGTVGFNVLFLVPFIFSCLQLS